MKEKKSKRKEIGKREITMNLGKVKKVKIKTSNEECDQVFE